MNTNKTKKIYQVTVDQMGTIATEILSYNPAVIMLSGSLGAGKTTLTQHIVQQLGIDEPVASPTYAYVTSYQVTTGIHAGLTIHHFDVYRLTKLQDFIDAGFEEYLYQPNALCIIEWPETIRPLITHAACDVQIDYSPGHNGNIERTITLCHLP